MVGKICEKVGVESGVKERGSYGGESGKLRE